MLKVLRIGQDGKVESGSAAVLPGLEALDALRALDAGGFRLDPRHELAGIQVVRQRRSFRL